MGPKRNRNTRKSRNNRKKHLTMGITSSDCTKEKLTRRTSQKENVCRLKSAFVLSSLSKYQFNRVPFGLAQAPAYCQKLINDMLKGCNFTMGYLDDIIIYSRSEKEHLEHLEEIFTRLRAAGLKTQTRKMLLLQKTHTVPWTLNLSRRNPTTTRETRNQNVQRT